MDLRILGPLELRVDDNVVPIREGRPRKILATLTLRLGQRVSTDTLIDVVWGESDAGAKLNSLQVQVSYLRKALSASGALEIETVEGGYRLAVSRDEVDAYRLEDAVASAGSSSDPLERLGVLSVALSAWRGPPVPEIADTEFAQGDVQRLTELRLTATEMRIDALLDLGRHIETLADLQNLVVLHPLRERFHAQLMVALYRAGRQADALAVYERARTLLLEELGLDPGHELQAMAQAVLAQSAQLEGPPRSARTTKGTDEHGGSEESAGHPRPSSPDPRQSAAAQPLDTLIGREDDVSRLTRLMAEYRLITLLGPGGAGKTRLAAELASRVSGTVWWVDLAGVPHTGGGGVTEAVTRAIGVSPAPEEGSSGVAALLARRDGLLVLDTCERVRAGVRVLVEALLRSCPGVKILTTSRKKIGAATELAWPIPPLSLPDPEAASIGQIEDSSAVRLFMARASSRRPGFRLTTANCGDIARICLLLDGLPLAIELAAAHASVLDPPTMLHVLDDRLRLLVDEAREDRQHTLRSTIAWSHDLLSDEESLYFDRLSVFPAAFSLDAAHAVAGDGLTSDGLELLLGLTEQSLVSTDGHGSFRLLDTVRAFALESLASREGEQAATQRRHAVWYINLLLDSGGSRRRADVVEGWRGELRDAVPDLRGALDWCFTSNEDELGVRLLSTLWWLWPREGVFNEAAQWFPHAKRLVSPGSALQADLLASSGTYAMSSGDMVSAAQDCESAATLYESLGYRRSLAQALIGLGIAHWAQGDYAGAAKAHDRATELFTGLADAWGIALTMVLRARTAIDAGDQDALDRLEVAEVAARRSRDSHVLAAALVQRARADIAAGRPADARRRAEEGLRLNEAHGHREGTVGCLHVLGLALGELGHIAAAREVLNRSLRTALDMHHSGATAESLDCLAVLAGRANDWAEAAVILTAGDEVRGRTGIRRSPLMTSLVSAVDLRAAERLEPAALLLARERGRYLDPADLLI